MNVIFMIVEHVTNKTHAEVIITYHISTWQFTNYLSGFVILSQNARLVSRY